MALFRPRALVLFLGDICSFLFALWLSLFVRELALPSEAVLAAHLLPFLLLFVVWVAVFFIAGLYESRSIVLARRVLSSTLLTAQTVNIAIAALFFFLVPLFGIAPKTLLLIYLIISFLMVLVWRALLFPWLWLQRPEPALLIGVGSEVTDIAQVLAHATRAPARIVASLVPSDTLAEEVMAAVAKHRPRFIIADFNDPLVARAFPEIYNLLLRGVRFFDVTPLYEDLLGREPLARIDERWLARNVSRSAHLLYDPLKRLIDVVAGGFVGLLSLPLYPCIALAITLQDGGPVFISQERVGEGGRLFRIYKFRTMSGNDEGRYSMGGGTKLVVTPVGRVLRVTRLDELPQIWNVLSGTLSLIGPRPELPALVATYEQEIPFYGIRHLIKPGLSGWAQLYQDNHPHHQAAVAQTREKLSFDLYYLKHRSLTLDVVIALKTIKKVLSRSGA